MSEFQKYLCVLLVILQSVYTFPDRRKRDDSESSIDYDALNSQIDEFQSSLDSAYSTFDYNDIATDVNSLASGLTELGITVTTLPDYSEYTQTAQPEETPATPSVFVSDIVNSYSSNIASRSEQQSSSPQAGTCLESSHAASNAILTFYS